MVYVGFFTQSLFEMFCTNFERFKIIQGVPKLCSSNLWATTFVILHEMALSSSCIQNVNNWHAPFHFLSHSVAIAAWSGIQRVDPQMIYFLAFSSPGAQEPLQPTNNINLFRLGIWKKYQKTIIMAAPFQFHIKAFELLYKSETSCTLLSRQSRGFFCHLRGLCFAFHEPDLDLAC